MPVSGGRWLRPGRPGGNVASRPVTGAGCARSANRRPPPRPTAGGGNAKEAPGGQGVRTRTEVESDQSETCPLVSRARARIA
jgi:hypothetical protein